MKKSLILRLSKSIFCLLAGILLQFFPVSGYSQEGYDNFEVAVYVRSYEVCRMGDLHWLDSIWTLISQQLHVDKVYLETHRDLVIVPEDTLLRVKKYFEDKGIETSGGITLTVSERNRFQTFCYSNPEHREKVRQIITYTAEHFDEIILDDFFFTNCKCHSCIEAKGDRSWTDFRLELMDQASRELILRPAKMANPDVSVIIKYPNWYGHFQGLGFNLETQPSIFNGIYTGTETRDATLSAQHLQPYHGYSIFRYFENIKPGGNFGGWVDSYGSFYLDRYAEQLWITLFAKAPEITLFDFRQMQRSFSEFREAPWEDQGASLNMQEMRKMYQGTQPTTIARTAGYVFDRVDPLIGQLGEPIGIKCYRPYHATGEDFLPSFLGMAGLPVIIVPEFPEEDSLILLTQSAAYDKDIVAKIRKQLQSGKSVVVTSGLLDVLQDKGLGDIAELRMTGEKALVNEYVAGWTRTEGDKKILIPQIKYLTNDSWELVSAIDGPNGWPLLHEAEYADGSLYVLTIPDNYADFPRLPEQVLNRIRTYLLKFQSVQLQAPGNVSLFLYDNQTLIIESFSDKKLEVKIETPVKIAMMEDMERNSRIGGEEQEGFRAWGRVMIPSKKLFTIELPPHSYRAYRLSR